MKILGIQLGKKATQDAVDPVCLMQVDMGNPPGGTAQHEGKTFYFCSVGCRESFVKDPKKYAAAAAA